MEEILKQAIASHQAGDIDRAVQSYQKYLAERPDSFLALSNLGAAYAHAQSPSHLRYILHWMPQTKIQTLASTHLLAGLAQHELEALAQRAVEKRYAPGELLFHEGDECIGLFVLGCGRVKIFKTSSSGREIMLAVDSAPSSVAEVPLFDSGNYPASVVAISEVVAYLIGKRDFQQVCREHPEVSLQVLAVVGRRLRHLIEIVEQITFGSVRQRLARALIEFGDQAGSDSFTVPVTHQELAQRLGTVREVVSRNLGRFQAKGLVRLVGRELQLLDHAGLEREAETEIT